MDHVKAVQATRLYEMIISAEKQLRVIAKHTERRALGISVTHETSDGWGSRNTVMLLQVDQLSPKIKSQIADFALGLQCEALQARINELGRELAQLGFKKPDSCK